MSSRKRSYTSDLRTEQARETRRRIVAAATALFTELGYGATTIDAVATRAGVSRKTVFTAVGGKGVLLKLAFDWAVTGDDEPVPMAERPVIRRIRESQDPDFIVTEYAVHMAETYPRLAPVALAVEAAAGAGEPDAVALLAEVRGQRLWGMNQMAAQLAGLEALPEGLSAEAAADLLWTLTDPAPYNLLVLQRGWTGERYAQWLAGAMRAAVLT